jgi:CheY-like chemotaxis protein
MITGEQFFHQLRSALNHLYDPYFLQKSPLVKLFNLGNQPDTPAGLQNILNKAIATLEPRPGGMSLPQRKRSYELLMYRYVQQFDQDEVSNQLGVSVRHLRREQNTAIYELAAYLWDHYQLGVKPFQIADMDIVENPDDTGAVASAPAAPEATDMNWIESAPLEEPIRLGQVLPAIIELIRPLAGRYQVELAAPTSLEASPVLAVHEVALRQILLNAVSVAIRSCGGGRIAILSLTTGPMVDISLRGEAGEVKSSGLDEDMRSSLKIAEDLARRYGGALQYQIVPAESLEITISLPVFQRKTLLVVDDNADFFQLVERTLTGMRYTVLHQPNPLHAVETALQSQPDLVLLDVMMPRVDGWEVLGRLRRHPDTAHIAVVICTILPQEDLALSLGASGFLRKPVTPERILSAVEQFFSPGTTQR